MYVPKHQYIVKNTSETGLLTYEDGKPYTNSTAVQTSSGQYYDVPARDLELGVFTNARKLVSSQTNIDNIPTVENSTPREYRLPSIVFRPTLTDRQNGTVTRYFFINTATGKVKEISQENYDVKSKDRPLYERVSKIDWRLKGPINDVYIGNRLLEGVAGVNMKAIKELEKEIPGVSAILSDPTQFVEDISLDLTQEPQDNSFYIPAPSKKL